jgi:hypothetical protein
MRCSALTWPMTGSIAARRFISRRMEAVTRRTCPEIQTLSRCVWLWPRYPLSTWMRRASTPVSFSMSGPSVCPSQRLPCIALAWSTKCPPFGYVTGGGGDTELAAELVRRAGFTLADALDLRSMKHIDLWTALMLFLGAHPQRQIEQRAEAGFQHRIAINLAADVADDPAEPRTQEHELPLGAFELVSAWV